MNRLNRRRFLALGAASTASVVLVACGNESPSEAELNPTQMPDVAGAPPTLAPITSTPSAQQGGGQEQAGGGEGGGGAAAALTITTLDSLAFDPSEADVSPGQTITVKNDGFLQHDLVVDEWGGEMVPLLNNGETKEFTVPEDAEVGASFVYYCSVPGHREGGMEGTFTIVEAGAAGGGEDQAAAGGEEQAAAGGGEQVVIAAMDSLAYDPSELEVSPGQTLTLRNDGFLQHNLVVDEWGGELVGLLNNAETGDFTVPDDAEVGSSVEYYCSVPGHREGGMVGTFSVVEAGAAAGGGEQQAAGTAEGEATAEGEQAAAGAGGGEPITIVSLDSLAYEPNEVEVSPGQQITLQNDGFLQHDLAVDAWGGEMVPLLNNGETGDFTIPEDAAVGEQVEFYCTVPGHKEGGMVGTFTIVEGGAAGGGEETAAAGTAEGEATAEGEGEQAAAGGEGGGATTAEVSTVDIAFEPTELTIAADTDVTITVTNNGALQHDFVVEDTEFATDLLNGGDTAELVVNLPEGEYVYFCSVPGHRQAGMEGTLTVVAGGGEAAAAGGAEQDAGTPASGEEAAAGTPAAEGGDASDPANVTVVATEWAFSPADFEVVPGGTIMLVNEGTVSHGMAAEALGGSFLGPVRAGGSAQFRVPSDVQPGDTIEYTAINSSAASLGMGGTITVIEGEGGEAAAGASPEASPAASPEAAAAGGSTAEPITIVTLDTLSFDPSEVEVSPGQTIIVQNDGFLQHDLAVDEWGGAMTELLNNGQTGEFTIPDDVAEGEQYVYYCTVAGHRQGGMEGTFTIVGGGSAAAGASPAASPAASPESSASGGGSDAEPLTIKAMDSLSFDPSEAEVSPGQTVILQNDGFLQHDIAVDEWGGALTELLNNGQTGEFTVPEDAEVGAEFVYYCTVAGHRQGGMEGTFTIV